MFRERGRRGSIGRQQSSGRDEEQGSDLCLILVAPRELQSWCISAYIHGGRDHERTGEVPIGPTGAGVIHGSNKWGGGSGATNRLSWGETGERGSMAPLQWVACILESR